MPAACDAARTSLLLPERGQDAAALQAHLAACTACARLARRLARLEPALAAAVRVEPPADLQVRLENLARAAARTTPPPTPQPGWWARLAALAAPLLPEPLSPGRLAAGLALTLAGWQVAAAVSSLAPAVGDVPYALQVLSSSPALASMSDLPPDVQSLGLWSLVGLGAWCLSESGPIGRWTASRRPRV